MTKITLKHFKRLYEHVLYYNKISPFPLYDTDRVIELGNKIKEMEKDKKQDYDNEPVVACKYCKSLHIVTDEIDNNVCMRCGSVNELKEFANIYEYNKFVAKKEDE